MRDNYVTLRFTEDWNYPNPQERPQTCEVVDSAQQILGLLPITSVKYEAAPMAKGTITVTIVSENVTMKGHT